MTNKNYLFFDVESAEVIEENPDSRFMTVKVQAFSTGKNLHHMYASLDTLKKTAPTLYDVPIIYNIVKSKNDFGTHVSPEDSLMCGFVVPNTTEFVELEDGRVGVFAKAKISKRYAPDVVDILKRRDGNSKVSVEMDLLASHMMDDGYEEMDDWIYYAVCLLGVQYHEASPLAHLEVLSFAEANNTYRKEYDMEFSNKYLDIDFTIPKSVKTAAQTSLDEYANSNISATSVSLAMARFLVKNEKISLEKLKTMAQFFGRSVEYDDTTKGFYGGKSGSKWSKEIMAKIKEIDEKRLSYFEEGDILTFPYSKISDAPENMKKLDGVPLTLGQINQIANVADAIGVNEEKNGYAIAKSQFKKSHHIEDDKWVKNKESMESDETEEFATPEDLGKGDALKVDKSKDKVSSTPWGDVDKTSLMHKVLGASNYKSLVRDVYLVVGEGWEEHPSSSLKYPVMQLIGDTFVYNKAGLSAALGRAKGQNEDAVASKVESIQKKLGLNKPEKEEYSVKIKKTQENKDAEVKFSLTASQITEILNNALSEFKYGENDWRKYWVYNFDSDFAYFRDSEDDKEYRAKYAISDLVASIDLESKEEVIEGMPLPVETKEYTPEFAEDEEETTDEKTDDATEEDKDKKGKEDEEKDPEKKNMSSLDANLDMAALMAMLEDETEGYKELVAKHEAGEEMDYSALCYAMYTKMCKMAEDSKAAQEDKDVYMTELNSLREYKAKIEKQQMDYAIEKTLQEVSDVFTKEEIEDAKKESEKFSLEDITTWQNNLRSIAFSRVKDKTHKKESFTRMAVPGSWLKNNESDDDVSKKYAKEGWLPK